MYMKGTNSYPGESSSSNITVSTSSARIVLLISATFPDPMYVLGFGEANLYYASNEKLNAGINNFQKKLMGRCHTYRTNIHTMNEIF